ncbi:MAG: hypothetical protein ACJ748_07790 [Flavisolibacter sp.]
MRSRLPVSLLYAYHIIKDFKPKDLAMIAELATIDAILSLSCWQLIRAEEPSIEKAPLPIF